METQRQDVPGDLKPNNVVEDVFLDFDELLANRVLSNFFTSTPNNQQAFE